MKQTFKGLLSIALLVAAVTVKADDNDSKDAFGKPFFAQRSQGDNLARRLVGEVHELVRCDYDCINGVISITPEWSQTFDSNEIGNYFSFRDPIAANNQNRNTNVMRFRGRLTTDPNFNEDTDVQAENFLLASDFDGEVTLNPRMKNFIADINFHLNLDEWLCGLYFEIGIPVNWTSWDMRLKEKKNVTGSDISILAADAPAVAPFTFEAPFKSIIEAWKGLADDTTLPFLSVNGPPIDNRSVPINVEKMKYARIDGKQSKTSVADLEFVLGYNFLCNDCYHLGANLRVTAPTGTRPDAEFVFEPIVGNGRHVQLGGGLTGHAILWENGCDQSFSIWFDSAVYHLFNAKQRRTFDLKENGVGSRYLLFKKFDDNKAFTNTFVPGPNVTSLDSKVKINVSGEAVVMFDYQRCGFTFDVGYNVWGRSKEDIKLTQEIEKDTYGLWGGTPIDNTDEDGNPFNPNRANFTNSKITINGDNIADVDTPNQVFVSNDNIDVEAAEAPEALTHKVFTHLGYTWEGCDYSPFFGVGGEVEFSGKRNHAFDQWGVWVKGGFAFS